MSKKATNHHIKTENGGAAMEYIIVSTFATLLAIATVSFVADTLKSKIGKLEDKLGVTIPEDHFNFSKDL